MLSLLTTEVDQLSYSSEIFYVVNDSVASFLLIQLHRRLLYDDNKGVVEPLDENAYGQGLVVRGKHVVQINDLTAAANAHRLKAVESAYQPVPTFAKTPLKLEDWRQKFGSSVSLLPTNNAYYDSSPFYILRERRFT